MNIRLPLLGLTFFAVLFILNAIDLFYVLDPVRAVDMSKPPTMQIYLIANFLPRFLYFAVKFLMMTATLLGAKILLNVAYDNEEKLFTRLLLLVVSLEFIFFLQTFYKIIFFKFLMNDYSFDQYISFFPFSFYDHHAENYLMLNKILKDLSIIDIMYFLLLALGLQKIFDITIPRALIFAFVGYLVPLILVDTFLYFIGF